MSNNIVAVFCANQDEINQAVQTWVNVKGYVLSYKADANYEAVHFVSDEAGQFSRSNCTPADKYKSVLVFEGE